MLVFAVRERDSLAVICTMLASIVQVRKLQSPHTKQHLHELEKNVFLGGNRQQHMAKL